MTVGGEPLDMDKLYKVATNDYMLGGGDGYDALGGGRVIIDERNGNLMANDVIDYIVKDRQGLREGRRPDPEAGPVTAGTSLSLLRNMQ